MDLGSGRNLCTSHILSNPSIKRFENCPVRGTRQAGIRRPVLVCPRRGEFYLRHSSHFRSFLCAKTTGRFHRCPREQFFLRFHPFSAAKTKKRLRHRPRELCGFRFSQPLRLGARRRPIGFSLRQFWRRSDNVAVTGAANRPSITFWWRESCHFFRTCANIDSFVRVTDVIRRKTWNLNGTRPFLF